MLKMYLKFLLILFLAISCYGQNDISEFIEGNRKFTQNLFKEILAVESGNFMTSPLSAQIILSLVAEGGVGNSQTELLNGLNLPNDQNTRLESIEQIMNDLTPDSLEYDLSSANKIYAAEDLTVKESFMQTASDQYGIEYENINFTNSQSAADTMNKWVEDQTNNKIQNLIPPSALSALTKAVLINTLYMNANWSSQFKKQNTKKLPFYKLEGNTVEVEMMNQNLSTEYYYCPKLKAQYLRLQYSTQDKNNLSMTIILPNQNNKLGDLEENLDCVFQQDLPFVKQRITVLLPKFKVETSINFKPILSKIGITDIFDASKADLSNMAGKKGDLYVSAVLQKTFIDVSEPGTEAAAATAVVITLTSLPMPPKLTFNADHPFLYYISLNDYILFAGKVVEPIYD